MVAVNQTIMLVLAMVVIAGILDRLTRAVADRLRPPAAT